MEKKEAGLLYVVGTPIGNLGDITLRALDTLRKVDVIVAEDTRRTLKLLNYYDIKKPLVSYHKHNEIKRSHELLQILESGEDIALVSDAGMPGISDPGQKLVRLARERGIKVITIPGVSAVTAALSISGHDGTPYAFYGFPPARGKERKKFFESLTEEKLTIVLFESPMRLKKTLADILKHLGDRYILVARELTKVHEEIFHGTVKEALEKWKGSVKGEITIVVEGDENVKQAKEARSTALDQAREELEGLISQGYSTRDATREISRKYSIPKSALYEEALKIIGEKK